MHLGNNEMLDEDEIHPQQQQQQHYVADVHCTTQEFQDAGGTYQTRGRKKKIKQQTEQWSYNLQLVIL